MILIVGQLTDRSSIHKTSAMIAVEDDHDDIDIRDIIVNALAENGRDIDAAHAMGIFPSTLSHWIAKLQISDEVDNIRQKRAS